MKIYNPNKKYIIILKEMKIDSLFLFAFFFNLSQVVPLCVFCFLST